MNLSKRHNQQRHIVVVDDRPEIGTVVRLGLEEFGHYRVSTRTSGDATLPLLDADRPDLVLLDAVLPGMSGIELAVHAVRRRIPVLLMTGEAAMQERLLRAGWPYLRKPFHLKELVAEVESALAQRRENHRALRQSLERMFQVRGDLQVVLDRLAEARRHAETLLARARRHDDADGHGNGAG